MIIRSRPREVNQYGEESFFNRFMQNFIYWLLIYDYHRNRAYKKAFKKFINRDSQMLEIGTGHQAFLTRMAARFQPKSILSVEENERSYKSALKVLNNSPYQNIKLQYIHTTQLKSDEKFNILFHEILGSIGSSEAAVYSIAPLKQSVLTNDCIHIPGRVLTYFFPVSTLELKGFSGFFDKYILRNDSSSTGFYRVYNFPGELRMADDQVFEDLDFQHKLFVPEEEFCEFTVNRPGKFDGFVLYMDIDFGTGENINTLLQRTNWSRPYIKILKEPAYLKKGEKIEVKILKEINQITPEYSLIVKLNSFKTPITYSWNSINRWGQSDNINS